MYPPIAIDTGFVMTNNEIRKRCLQKLYHPVNIINTKAGML
jgi:hypothetical protein